jgi:hypothetical protein
MSYRRRTHYDLFNVNGVTVWNKRAGARLILVCGLGAGAGGNGGGLAAVAGSVNPALGGCGGAWAQMFFPADLLGNTENVTVGKGGLGGNASVVAGSLGAAGGNGGNSTFGSWLIFFGPTGSLVAGAGVAIGLYQISGVNATPSTNGGASNGVPGNVNLNVALGGGAGGCGGIITAGVLGTAPGVGGTVGNNGVQVVGKMGYAGLLAGGISGGGNGNTLGANSMFGGSGGGGGNALITPGAAQIGGTGGGPGGGGGGGGAGLSGTSTAANGGPGADGAVLIFQIF